MRPDTPPPSAVPAAVPSDTALWASACFAGGAWGTSTLWPMGPLPALLALCGWWVFAAVRPQSPWVGMQRAAVALVPFAAIALWWVPGAVSTYGASDGPQLAVGLGLGLVLPGLLAETLAPAIGQAWWHRPAAWAVCTAFADLCWGWAAGPEHALIGLPAAAAWVGWVGVPGLHALLVSLPHPRTLWNAPRPALLALAAVALATALPLALPSPPPLGTVGLVGTQISGFDGRRATRHLAHHRELLDRIAPALLALAPNTSPDVLVLPEGAWSGPPLAQLPWTVPTVMGHDIATVHARDNAAIVYRDGRPTDRYLKHALVPVLEASRGYQPGPASPRAVPGVGSLPPFDIRLCSEALSTRRLATVQGAWLAVPSQDAFTPPPASHQHLTRVAWSAVRTGRAVARANNEGPVAVFDALGRAQPLTAVVREGPVRLWTAALPAPGRFGPAMPRGQAVALLAALALAASFASRQRQP